MEDGVMTAVLSEDEKAEILKKSREVMAGELLQVVFLYLRELGKNNFTRNELLICGNKSQQERTPQEDSADSITDGMLSYPFEQDSFDWLIENGCLRIVTSGGGAETKYELTEEGIRQHGLVLDEMNEAERIREEERAKADAKDPTCVERAEDLITALGVIERNRSRAALKGEKEIIDLAGNAIDKAFWKK